MFNDWTRRVAPSISDELTREIARVGGLIPLGCGEFSGKPLFRLQHGFEATKFANGKTRLRYPARARLVKRYYAVRPETRRRILVWIDEQVNAINEAFMRLDLQKAYSNPEITDFLRQNTSLLEGVDYRELDSSKSLPDLNRECEILGMDFVADCPRFEQIGKPYFYIQRWIPSPRLRDSVCPQFTTNLDTESSWQAQRYEEAFYPETQTKKVIDTLGDYPSNGGYFHDLACLSAEDGTPLEATDETVIGPIRAYLSAREEISAFFRNNKEYRLEVSEKEMIEAFDTEMIEWEDSFEARFKSSIPALGGEVFVTKHHNTPEIIIAKN